MITLLSSKLDKAVSEAQRAILDKMLRFDNIKSATEEEIDLQIIKDEIDPVAKMKDRLTTAVHMKFLPEFIEYYLAVNKKVKHRSIKQVFRLLFSSFIAGGKNSLKIILPILEVIESEEELSSKIFKEINQEIEERIIFWLQEEIIVPGESPTKILTIIKKTVDELNISDKNAGDYGLDNTSGDKAVLIKLIRNCDLLINEAKIRLINKINIFTEEEIDQLGKFLAAEIRYSKEHRNFIIKKTINILKEIEEKIITCKL